MYKLKNSLITLAGLLALIGVVAAVTPFTGYGKAGPEAVQAAQDVRVVNTATDPALTRDVDGARSNNIVTLVSTNIGFRRVNANGIFGSGEFTVPSGQVLIVTDVEWTSNCSCSSGSGQIVLEANGAGGSHRPVYASYAPRGSDGRSGANDGMETGFAVEAGGRVTLAPTLSSANTTYAVYLHGYLAPDN